MSVIPTRLRAALLPLLVAVQACAPTTSDDEVLPKSFPDTVGGQRAAPVVRPSDFSEDETLPAVILLHGYAATANLEDVIFQLRQRVDTDRFLLVLPEGTLDSFGLQFWNAYDECCNFSGSDVDDVAWLTRVSDEVRAGYNVSTVTVAGHSNGGYMGYRLACDAPEALDRLMVLAGSGPITDPACADGAAIPLLHVHATADDTITYAANDGTGDSADLVPTVGAVETVRRYAARQGCEASTTTLGAADLTSAEDGDEATGVAYEGCPAPVALWTIEGGDHYYLGATETLRDGITAFALGADPTF